MGLNQFKVEKFNRTCSVGTSADIPIDELDGLTPDSIKYMNDSTSMDFVSVFGTGDNYMLRASAWLYMTSNYTVSATIKSDDGSKWILNDVVIGSTNYDAGTKTVTFAFKAGFNHIVGLFAEIAGGDNFTLSPSTQFSTIGELRSDYLPDLKANLEQILQEKNTKLIPENIKIGVTIFDVNGAALNNVEDNEDYIRCLNLTNEILELE